MELNQLHYPFAEQAGQINGFVLKEKKAYIAGLGRDQLEHLASPMTKSETNPSPNTNESKTIEKCPSPRPDSSTTALRASTALKYHLC